MREAIIEYAINNGKDVYDSLVGLGVLYGIFISLLWKAVNWGLNKIEEYFKKGKGIKHE